MIGDNKMKDRKGVRLLSEISLYDVYELITSRDLRMVVIRSILLHGCKILRARMSDLHHSQQIQRGTRNLTLLLVILTPKYRLSSLRKCNSLIDAVLEN